MAFKTLNTTREAISLTTLGKRIAERRLVVGAVDVPRNEGKRRTPSKQALLMRSPRPAASGEPPAALIPN
jgi:hypothetical protein